MRILFWGTPAFAVPSLRALEGEGFDIVGVVTQRDRPAGRGRNLAPSAVKEAALQLGLDVLTPEVPRGPEFLEQMQALEPDLSIVVAYGHILRPEVLDLPELGSINVHASLLPELRGAAPVHWAIARGHSGTGVTVMRMVEAMDAGPILYQVHEPILSDETSSELMLRLSEVGAAALIEALALMSTGAVDAVEQDHEAATFAPKVDREIARIDWAAPARDVALHVRAMDAVPGAWSELEGASVKFFRPSVIEGGHGAGGERASTNGGPPVGSADAEPGTFVPGGVSSGLTVRAGDGYVAFAEVQPSGGRRMSAEDWVRGRGVVPGQRFS